MVKIISIIYFVTTAFWVLLTVYTGHTNHPYGLYFQILLFIIPFLGALAGFRNAKLWGGFRSAIGKAIILISLGTLTWSIGMLAWNYFIFVVKVEVPYPSWADAAFILSWPLWALGVVYLSKATGVKFALRQTKGKILLFIVPIVAIVASYYLLIKVARGGIIELDVLNVWKLFFDLFYPIGTAVILAVALTFFSLSRDFLGGRYKIPIAVLVVAFLINYLSDFMFSYTTTNGTYFNGHLVDFLFVTAMYLLSMHLSLMTIHNDKKLIVEDKITIL
jgi:hypothetical protein